MANSMSELPQDERLLLFIAKDLMNGQMHIADRIKF